MSDRSSEGPRLVIAGSFTAEPLEDTLRFWARHLNWSLSIRFAPYGQVHQQLLAASSALAEDADLRVVAVSWDDLVGNGAPKGTDDWLTALDRAVVELEGALGEAVTRLGGTWLLASARSGRGFEQRDAVEAHIRETEAALSARLAPIPGLRVLSDALLDRLYPVGRWHDAVADRAGHVPYTQEYYAALGTAIARSLHATTTPARKVVVFDCDNTLWGGVVGEDGPAGLEMGPPFAGLRESARRLTEEGKLVCLASKNHEPDVRAVFDLRREELGLGWDQVVAHRVNWDAKPNNLIALSEELDLGLDSFVFVDDNPIERAAMEAALPQVLTVPFQPGEAGEADVLEHVWELDSERVTAEDRARAQMYRQNVERQRLRGGSSSLDDFLASLELRIEIGPVETGDVPRASQLTQRTNQFNSTTLRRSEADLLAFLDDPSRICLRTAVADRFGDYGTVGLCTAVAGPDALDVDGFMLSCRALARGVEYAMVRSLAEAARERGLPRLRLRFEPSERNEPLDRFFRQLAEASGVDWAAGPLELDAVLAAEARPPVEMASQVPVESRPAASTSGARPTAGAVPLRWRRPDRILAAVREDLGSTRPQLREPNAEPRSATERVIADAWRAVLKLDRVGIDDRFTDLGGTSLDLVFVLGIVSERLGRDLEITTLLERPTVRALARHVDGLDPVARVQRAGERGARQRLALTGARYRGRDRRPEADHDD